MYSVTPERLARSAMMALVLSLPHWVWAPVMAQPVGLPSMGATSGADLSVATERRLGELIMRQGRLDPTYVHDIEINQYLNQMARQLVRYAPGGATGIEAFAVRDPQFNAFAMPGGYVGINTGVMAISENESELAGVLAHEIAHVTQRHVARGLTQQQQSSVVMLASIAGALLAALTGGAGLAAGIAAFGQAAAIDQQLGFSRGAESEADRIGLQMLARAGFNPAGLQDMFGKLMQTSSLNQGMSGGNTYLSTHQLDIDRMSDMQNRTRSLPASTYRDSPAYHYVRARALVTQVTDRESARRARDRMADEAIREKGLRRSAAYLALSELASRQGDQAQAWRNLESASQGVDASPYLTRQRAWLELLRGQPQAALQTARSGAQRWPDHMAFFEVQARALQQLGQHEQAAQVLGKVLKKWPDAFPNLYQQQANELMRAKQPIEGRRVMAQYYVLTGAFAAAIAQLEQARQMTNDFREQSLLDVRIREIKKMMTDEREVLERFER